MTTSGYLPSNFKEKIIGIKAYIVNINPEKEFNIRGFTFANFFFIKKYKSVCICKLSALVTDFLLIILLITEKTDSVAG